ncbi:phosphoribosylformylglycinamidine synthase subunit PurS [Methanogenium organophilum]|uniref:Phosphoribosylformylglycinamidine synthase subunit PurS n=1 Tax=Methanogenium organophilum TaxID=2199 RepID=A0A9X9S3N0_METOG|nr:phosphoribosylformylglycinamidine synthase subunit PurS [Methanogenium organophilum]WAI01309.1 phosphoribosylformylglycinamidine synthase subunit PurS [Methanogenium organophilum]
MTINVKITISLKDGMLDPEARAIQHALSNLGYATETLSTARVFNVGLDADSAETAERMATEMCNRLLANPVIHSYEIEVI